MNDVRLTGRLLCKSVHESELVRSHLPAHIQLTLAEPGCLSFDVSATEDPLVWSVSEHFVDAAAFTAHQARIAASEWGRMTAGITRDYTVTGPNS